MAQLHNFDATTVSPTIPFEPVLAGKYQVAITTSTAKLTRSNHGEMLELTFTILEGAYRNRRVWDYLCIQHPNSQVSSIARANLSAICHAVGILRPQDTMELHNIPLCIQVGLKKRYPERYVPEYGARLYASGRGAIPDSVTDTEYQYGSCGYAKTFRRNHSTMGGLIMRDRQLHRQESEMSQLLKDTWDAGWMDGYEEGEQKDRDEELGLGPYAADVLDIVDHLVRSETPWVWHDLLKQRYIRYETARDACEEV